MSIISKKQKTDGPEAVASHPDFQLPWCQELIQDPQLQWTVQVPRSHFGGTVTNHMFEKTLDGPDGIRAHLSWTRPSREADAVTGIEERWLLSIGHEVDGRRGRAHGGFNALVLDQISGSVSHHSRPLPEPPATATLTVDYRAPVSTPCVILLRAWIIEKNGRKVWVKATIENGQGVICCASKALFVFPRSQPDQKL
jgi:acyl-coenzyme A thioesterase PaaI-like protein